MIRHLASLAKTKVHINVGTIGHVDHGKTTLTSAITKYSSKHHGGNSFEYDEIDRAPEEKLRGITINASHVEYLSKSRRYNHTDCPGHADFVKNMISGASRMEAAILVVDANEGQMPQTREHLLLAKQVGVNKIIVYVNKCDEAAKDVQELVELEIRELLEDFGFEGSTCPIIFGSALMALRGDGTTLGEKSIARLLDVLDEYIPDPVRDTSSPFLMPLDSAFTVPGRGTVVVGTMKRGTLSKGDECHVAGFGRELASVVTDLHVFRRPVARATAGENVGALLRGLKAQQVEKGMLLVQPDTQEMTNRFVAQLYLLARQEGGRSKPLTGKYIQQLFSQTWNIAVRVDLLDAQMLMPGEHARVALTLLRTMIMLEGQTFTIRENQSTVATGIILNPQQKVNIPRNNLAKIK